MTTLQFRLLVLLSVALQTAAAALQWNGEAGLYRDVGVIVPEGFYPLLQISYMLIVFLLALGLSLFWGWARWGALVLGALQLAAGVAALATGPDPVTVSERYLAVSQGAALAFGFTVAIAFFGAPARRFAPSRRRARPDGSSAGPWSTAPTRAHARHPKEGAD